MFERFAHAPQDLGATCRDARGESRYRQMSGALTPVLTYWHIFGRTWFFGRTLFGFFGGRTGIF